MTWRETARSQAALIRETWLCDICELEWITKRASDDEPVTPECPNGCDGDHEQVRRPVGVRTNASRAVDVTYTMAEEKYGVTNMRDHLKPGDTANVSPPPIQTAESEAITRALLNGGRPELGPELQKQVTGFFGAANGPPAPAQNPVAASIQAQLPTSLDAGRAMAAPGVMASRSMAADPIALLHHKDAKRQDPLAKQNLEVMSKEKPRGRG